jgi:ketosteroid isomerase-like protein
MSCDDRIELLREIYAAWGRGDYSRGGFLHPDFELVFAPGFLDEGAFKGSAAAWRGWKDWLDQWETWHYEPVRYMELADGRIAVFIDMHGVSRTTGVKLPGEGANVWEFDDGLIRRLVLYAHRDDMLRDLGLGSS